MAVTVSTREKTRVRKVTVGKPIRRIREAVLDISQIGGIDISAAEEGSTLVYNPSNGTFEAKKELLNTDINGGQY